MNTEYTAVMKQDGDWWIGWIEEIPGINCQERTRDELTETLRITLREAEYADFLKEWAKIEDDQTWDKLLKLINTPMDLEAAVQARKAEEKPQDNSLEE